MFDLRQIFSFVARKGLKATHTYYKLYIIYVSHRNILHHVSPADQFWCTQKKKKITDECEIVWCRLATIRKTELNKEFGIQRRDSPACACRHIGIFL